MSLSLYIYQRLVLHPRFASASLDSSRARGEVPEWPKGTDCKSVGDRLRRFESSPPHHSASGFRAGIAQLARASAFQAEGRGFESRFPLHLKLKLCRYWIHQALVAQSVEHLHGKQKVTGSNPVEGSTNSYFGGNVRWPGRSLKEQSHT